MKRIVSGIQPTNGLTLGNYLGSIKQFIQLQNNYEMLIFVADLHAITTGVIEKNELKNNSLNLVRSYLAFGINPEKCIIFLQSDVSEHTELGYFLMCQTTIGELNRMTQFKDKSIKYGKENNGTQKIPTGLLIYPTLMASDILLYSPDYVPVGFDQKQHLELTRNLAERINHKLDKNIFKIPEIFLSNVTSKIYDLQNPQQKMSKSNTNKKGVIFLNDPIEESIKKIMSAKTDSFNKIKYDKINQPEIHNLINIYSGLTNMSPDEICTKYEQKNYAEFKKDLADILKEFLTKYQNNFNVISDNQLLTVLEQGYKKAKIIAQNKLNEVYKSIGFLKNEK